MRALLSRLRRASADERGSVTVEAVIILPVLFWTHVAGVVFFEAFRSQSVSVKAAYTIADVLSRQADVTPPFMDSLLALQGFLVPDATAHSLRVTAFRFRANGAGAADDVHQVVWSEPRGGGARLTTAGLALLRDRLPVMADGDMAVLTESWVTHQPAFDLLDPFTYRDFVVTRPRVAPKLCWIDGTTATPPC